MEIIYMYVLIRLIYISDFYQMLYSVYNNIRYNENLSFDLLNDESKRIHT